MNPNPKSRNTHSRCFTMFPNQSKVIWIGIQAKELQTLNLETWTEVQHLVNFQRSRADETISKESSTSSNDMTQNFGSIKDHLAQIQAWNNLSQPKSNCLTWGAETHSGQFLRALSRKSLPQCPRTCCIGVFLKF